MIEITLSMEDSADWTIRAIGFPIGSENAQFKVGSGDLGEAVVDDTFWDDAFDSGEDEEELKEAEIRG